MIAAPHAPATHEPTFVTRSRRLMGGTVQASIGLDPVGTFGPACERPSESPSDLAVRAERSLDRLEAWAARLTRFSPTSELSRVNADPRSALPIGPTLAAVLDWGRAAETMTDGLVDVSLLDARLAAESASAPNDPGGRPGPGRLGSGRSPGSRAWSLTRGPRAGILHRPWGLRFDLDGIAKGWLADRALRLLGPAPVAFVDADGDVAIRISEGRSLAIGVDDPRRPGARLAVLRLAGSDGPARFGVATSGTSVHRWPSAGSPVAGGIAHHLIDPATLRPAATDVVQATVIAGSAREAEAFAKTAVILGSVEALRLSERPGVLGAILLTEAGEVLALPGTGRWLA